MVRLLLGGPARRFTTRALRWLNPTAVALRQQTAVPEAAAFVLTYRQATLEACNH